MYPSSLYFATVLKTFVRNYAQRLQTDSFQDEVILPRSRKKLEIRKGESEKVNVLSPTNKARKDIGEKLCAQCTYI